LTLGILFISKPAASDDRRCTHSDELHFLGQHSEDIDHDPDIDDCDVAVAWGPWQSFIEGTDLGKSVYNADLGIYHFYMGDTWGLGEGTQGCDELPEYECAPDARRNDTLGWIEASKLTSPGTGIDIQMRQRDNPFGAAMNGFGIRGIHNDLGNMPGDMGSNPTLQNFWAPEGDWVFTTPSGVAHVREYNDTDDKFSDDYTLQLHKRAFSKQK